MAMISSLTPLCSLPKTRQTGSVKFNACKPTASLLKCVVYIFFYFLRNSAKHSEASVNWCTVNHLAALDELLAPHFLWGGILLFRI